MKFVILLVAIVLASTLALPVDVEDVPKFETVESDKVVDEVRIEITKNDDTDEMNAMNDEESDSEDDPIFNIDDENDLKVIKDAVEIKGLWKKCKRVNRRPAWCTTTTIPTTTIESTTSSTTTSTTTTTTTPTTTTTTTTPTTTTTTTTPTTTTTTTPTTTTTLAG